ncbi:MAG: prenyltransferase/squalene oxidase repeat-containing protein [bacterium]
MSNAEENMAGQAAVAPPPEAPPPEAPRKETEGGRASWEDPNLSFQERLRTQWRQMLVHLWGPAGSLVFHVVAIGVLVTFATGNNTTEVISEPVMLEAKAEPELEKPPEPEKVKPPEPVEQQVETPQENNIGFSTVESAEIGGSGTQETGVGLGTGDPNLPDKGFEIATTVKSRLVMRGLYAGRTAGGRKGALGLYGKGGAGGAATEAAVLRALRWLKKNQNSDGSWAGTAAPAMTAMALLSYLAHGETPQSPEFGNTVKKAIEWFILNQDATGHFKGRDGNDYSQPISAYALCEAYGLTQHPSLKDTAVKAIMTVVKGQHASGGFNYQLEAVSERNDSSYMAWCCQALKAAKMAGLEPDVPGLEPAIKKAIAGFKLNANADGGFGYSGPGRGGLSGAGALCMQLLGAPRAAEVVNTMKFLETCTFSFAMPDQQPYGGGSQVYYWYYITQAKFHHSPETFAAWNKLFSPELCKQQIIEKNAIEGPDGKMVDIGHWVSPVKNEHTGGVVQDTSLCTLMLEVYYRYLPSFKKIEAGPEDVVAAVAPKAEDVNVKIK